MKKFNFVFGNRSLLMTIALSLLLIYGMYSFADGFKFFFHSKVPLELGDAMQMNKEALSAVTPGTYVRMTGIRSIQGGKIEKGFIPVSFMTYYFMGNPKIIVVQKMNEDQSKNSGAQIVNIMGRIYPFSYSEKMMRIRDFFEKNFAIEMDKDGYIIYADQQPGEDYFSLLIFSGMGLFLLLLIVFGIRHQFFPKAEEDDLDSI